MHEQKIHATIIVAVLAALSDMPATITLPGFGPCEPSPFTRGGKQGGRETPMVWTIFLDFILQPAVEKWNTYKYGLRDLDNFGEFANRCIWSDNLFLLADGVNQGARMTQDVMEAWEPWGLRLKTEDMKCVCKWPLHRWDRPILGSIPIVHGGNDYFVEGVMEVPVLGTGLAFTDSAKAATEHKTIKADTCCFKLLANFKKPGSLLKKARAWAIGPQTSMLRGGRAWALTSEVVKQLKTWELKWLRKIFKLRPRRDEEHFEYLQRTAALIAE